LIIFDDENKEAGTTYLRIGLVPPLLGSNPPGHEVILDGVGEGEVVVPRRRNVPVLDEGVVQVAVKALLDVGDVLDGGDGPHGDLFPPVGVGNGGLGHGRVEQLSVSTSGRQFRQSEDDVVENSNSRMRVSSLRPSSARQMLAHASYTREREREGERGGERGERERERGDIKEEREVILKERRDIKGEWVETRRVGRKRRGGKGGEVQREEEEKGRDRGGERGRLKRRERESQTRVGQVKSILP